MIERHQIAEALGRLDARDREVLDYSLRRRVPDTDLAAIFGTSATEVARQRAGAIEKLSADLGAQRGADLGHILKELLEGETWEAATVSPAGTSPEPDADPQARPEGHRPLGALDNPEPEPAAKPSDDREPVLGMLGDQAAEGRSSSGRGRRRLLVGIAAAIAVLAPAGVVYALTSGGDDANPSDGATSATRSFSPQKEVTGEPFPSDPQSADQFPTVRVDHRTALYDEPNGKVKLRVSGKTEWDSPRVLGVVERRGKWLGVLVPELKNGDMAWVRDDRVAEVSSVTWALRADLSRRRLVVEHDGKVVRRMKIGVGRGDHPTPVGRYAVTDKLRVSDPGSPYGCCVVALTGHQTKLPPGWPGGDRLAVHATRDLGGLGKPVSLGCMRTQSEQARWLINNIPLGSPLFVGA
jgi:L,D-transpeptidase catalytic domain